MEKQVEAKKSESGLKHDTAKTETRGLKILVGVIGAVIIGLVTALVMILLSSKSPETDQNEEIQVAGIVMSGNAEIDTKMIEFQKEIEATITENPEQAAELYQARAFYLNNTGVEKEYEAQALEDLIAADNILQTHSSAIEVSNFASRVGNAEVYEKYQQIIKERRERDYGPSDPEVEVRG